MNHLIAAIREDKPYNEVERGVKQHRDSDGAYGQSYRQIVTYDDMLNCEHEFAPCIDKLTLESDAPLKSDADGKYPVPHPGIVTSREY